MIILVRVISLGSTPSLTCNGERFCDKRKTYVGYSWKAGFEERTTRNSTLKLGVNAPSWQIAAAPP